MLCPYYLMAEVGNCLAGAREAAYARFSQLGRMGPPMIANALSKIRSGDAPIEEGGFGKGYALDRMMTKIAGDAVINFGGQIIVRGTAPVTIADPRHRDRALVALTLHDASLSTSSGSEKTFIVNGRQFTHIIDPRTGEALPPRGSVSVIASSLRLRHTEL